MNYRFRLTVPTLMVAVTTLLATEANADLGQSILDAVEQYSGGVNGSNSL